MPTVFCTQCGHENVAGANFCSNCGTQLATAERPGDATSTLSLAAIDSLIEADQSPGAVSDLENDIRSVLLPGTAMLVVLRGPSSGSRFLLDKEVTTAGRHPNSDIFLDDVTVSRRHAEFVRGAGDRFEVRDVGSLNGTYVNRERVERRELRSGDEVQVGKYRLVYYSPLGVGE